MMISMKYLRPGQRKRFGFCLLVLYRANTYKDTETPDFMLSNFHFLLVEKPMCCFDFRD